MSARHGGAVRTVAGGVLIVAALVFVAVGLAAAFGVYGEQSPGRWYLTARLLAGGAVFGYLGARLTGLVRRSH
ncbi:hypothetical protein [Georgenia muralis]|uniref:Uncharacterized protein n=1 Tax=Georgenia muralis TaxID=154117 RepID=A0A3N4Z5F2_9MICO|nr:hypothetical protein [Georgenia muralis]RPF26350.1 hypothetical protein EDD32_0789 [Georgenia muralis]